VTGRPSTGTRSQSAQFAILTSAKVVSNTALRWVGPFLPTLERAFSSTTGVLTGIIGVSELGGLSTVATGKMLDRGGERRLFALGLSAVSASSLIALYGTVTSFAISFAVLVLGVGNLTIAGHAWIGHRVPFAARGRAIGLFETSWAIALLGGAPLMALLIRWFGWRGPYVALAVGAALAALAVTVLVSPGAPVADQPSAGAGRLPRSAWPPMLTAACTAVAGLGMFVVSGAWLNDAHGISTAGLGLIAAGFGLVELVASTSVASFGDRVGSRRSVLLGLAVLGVGLTVMLLSDQSRPLAIAGLLVYLAGFEYAFVSALTLVTEAAPLARGRAIGVSNALGTVARATAVVASGQLYASFGMTGSLTMTGCAAVAATMLAIASRPEPQRHRPTPQA
jgi:DHA1 family inner membrane transport protein